MKWLPITIWRQRARVSQTLSFSVSNRACCQNQEQKGRRYFSEIFISSTSATCVSSGGRSFAVLSFYLGDEQQRVCMHTSDGTISVGQRRRTIYLSSAERRFCLLTTMTNALTATVWYIYRVFQLWGQLRTCHLNDYDSRSRDVFMCVWLSYNCASETIRGWMTELRIWEKEADLFWSWTTWKCQMQIITCN